MLFEWTMTEYQRSPLYGELSQGTRPTGRTQLRYKNVCKWDPKVLQRNIQTLQTTASDRTHRRQAVNWELKEIWRVVGCEGISDETRPKRKRTLKRRRQLHLLTLRKRLPLPYWTVKSQRTRMIHGGIVPNGYSGSVSSNLLRFILRLLRSFFGKWDWFVQMVIPERVYRFRTLFITCTWTDRFAHVNGKQSTNPWK